MPVKFLSDIEVKAGLKDSSGSIGASGQVLSSTGSNVSWINQTTIANDVQNLVKAGVAITKGQAVYVTGADGTNIIVGLASNTSEATSSKTLGLLNATVAINGMADVVQIGRLSGLNTIGATAGDPVWLGTNGNLIYGLANKPYAPAHLVFLGIVTRVNANNGEIFVNVQNGFELKEIHDVDIITNVPINGDVLGYDGTLWVNKTIAEWLGYIPANASGTTNYVSKFTGSASLGDSQIFDNGTFVGIGTNAPNATLQVGNGAGVKAIYVTGSGTNLGLGGLSVSFLGFATGTISTVNTSGAVPLGVGTRSTQPLVLGTNNAERMRIDSSGNVSIGTTSTSYKLQVVGVVGIGQNTNGTATIDAYGGNAYFGCDGTQIAVNGISGNVGIGTTSPTRILDVAGLSMFNGTQLRSTDDSSTIVGFVGNRSAWTGGSLDNNLSIAAYTSNMCFFTNNSVGESMRITSGGNVGIGTTSPTAKLHIWNGGIKASGFPSAGNPFTFLESNYNDSVVNVKFLNINPTNGVDADLGVQLMNTGGTMSDVLTIKGSTGNVGIGTTIPSYKTVIHSSSVDTDVLCVSNDQINADSIQHFVGISLQDQYSNGSGNVSAIRSYSNLYSQWGSALTFSTTGTGGNGVLERMRINASGNVGIGTSFISGATKLHVEGGKGLIRAADSSWGQFAVVNPNADEVGIVWAAGGAGYPGYDSIYTQQWIAGLSPFGTGISKWSLTNKTLGANTAITVLEAGNVGIGTTSPQAKLHINNGADRNLWFRVNGSGTGTELLSINDAQSSRQSLSFSASSFYFDNGNVGIGTTSPIEKLDVSVTKSYNQSADIGIALGGTDNGFVDNFSTSSWRQFVSGNASGQSLRFDGFVRSVGWVERMRITSGGNVGIGTTAPSEKLDVYGVIRGVYTADPGAGAVTGKFLAYSPSAYGLVFRGYNTGAHSIQVQREANNAEIYPLSLQPNGGNVGIGTISPSGKLDVFSTSDVYQNIVTSGSGVSSVLSMYNSTGTTDGAAIGYNVAMRFGTITGVNAAGFTERMRITSSGNVGIGTASPHASALLHLRSTTRGFLPPVMRTGERDSISSPAAGLMIFNTDDEVIQVYTDGSGWRTLAFL